MKNQLKSNMLHQLFRHLSVALLGMMLLCSCQESPDKVLRIAAAASLRDAFQALQGPFETQQQMSVHFSFAASGLLKMQIQQGAEFDLFASADFKDLEELQQAGLLSGRPQVLARNQLILAAGPREKCSKLSPGLGRLAIGNPNTVPAGQYAQQFLREHSLWEALKPQLILTENARQISSYLREGVAAYGLIYASDLKVYPELKHCQKLSDGLDIRLGQAALHSAQASAQLWLKYSHSKRAQSLLRQHGFETP